MKKVISIILLGALCGSMMAQQSFLTTVPTDEALAATILSDTYVRPRTSSATSNQSGEGIARTYDRNSGTLWHSNYSIPVTASAPVTINYIFADTVSQIDYVTYYPRVDGNVNGNFKEVEIWYSVRGDNQPMIKYGEYDFAGSSSPSEVVFSPVLPTPDTIRFVIKSGTNNYASCSEMEFYRRNPDAFHWEDIFTDRTCSELKPGVTAADIRNINGEFYQKLASDILTGNYNSEFRVQEYQCYQDPSVMATLNKTAKYGLSDNPTGIYATAGEPLIVLAGDMIGVSPSIWIRDPEGNNTGKAHTLRAGVNKITPTNTGLMYIRYYTQTGTEPPIKLNIVTGTVNGYYDKVKNAAAGEWQRLLNKATFSFFDVKGEYALMNFKTSAWKTYAATNGPDVIEAMDDLVYSEQVFQGMLKYNKMNKTRMLIQGYDTSAGVAAFATDYWTAYGSGAAAGILSMATLKSTTNTTGAGAWCPAHEIGHVNQTRPGFRWLGMTEVSNNVLSMYITIKWGIRSRLQDENLSGINRYTKAIRDIVTAEKAHVENDDPFCKLVPFWQLKLYMHDVIGNDDFYKDLYEKIRVNPNPTAKNGCTTDGSCQLEFVRLVCEVSGYDFTDFFEKWGMLRPFSGVIEDYSTSTFTVSQAGIDAVKAEIAAMNLPLPPVPAGKKLYEINDSNYATYRMP